MSFQPDPLQRLLLWRLAVSDEGAEFLKNLESKLDLQRRRPLVRDGLIDEQKRKIGGRGQALSYLELTDKGWAWCQNHLGDPFGFRGQTPKLAGVVLERLLGLLKRYFENTSRTASLGEFVLQARAVPVLHEENGQVPTAAAIQEVDVEQEVRRVYLDLSRGRENVRVRLADLRRQLATVPQPVLDETLRNMERRGQLSLYPLDDPREIQPEDRQAALRIAGGNERHVVYLGGTRS